MDIGIVAEGITDQIIIEAIVQGHLQDKNIVLEQLQPKKDAPGGWPLVISYCKSEDFRQSFPYRDGFTIIHIDCDVLKGDGLPLDCIIALGGLTTSETFEEVSKKLLEFIGMPDVEEIRDKIIFAIAIDSTECWFLPLYHVNKPVIANKVSGCVGTLNKVLPKEEGFYIDAKEPDHYRLVAKHYLKSKNIATCYKMNESFRLFIDELERGISAYKTVE